VNTEAPDIQALSKQGIDFGKLRGHEKTKSGKDIDPGLSDLVVYTESKTFKSFAVSNTLSCNVVCASSAIRAHTHRQTHTHTHTQREKRREKEEILGEKMKWQEQKRARASEFSRRKRVFSKKVSLSFFLQISFWVDLAESTQMHSFSELKAMKLASKYGRQFMRHNVRMLSRIYPKVGRQKKKKGAGAEGTIGSLIHCLSLKKISLLLPFFVSFCVMFTASTVND
jgi:hypothetical protein